MFDFVRYGVYKMMKQDSWAQQYDPNNRFSVEQYAFNTEEEWNPFA